MVSGAIVSGAIVSGAIVSGAIVSGSVVRVPGPDHFRGDLEVLIILRVPPASAPPESAGSKSSVTKIVFVDLTGEIPGTVNVSLAIRRLDAESPVNGLHIRVVARVDIHSQSQTML